MTWGSARPLWVVATEAYLRRLDMTRVYADAYQRAG